ncbi:putative spliceosome-associated protein [Trypanosoma theileri]|uniref:Putative spliceosome-associated protein n=1 Tax=Trypanosoma theileri TaxID=67003 RepID=A0A1X0P248_9TRYP|nr:putative spliceosome-associated protein [Trypanosoma theileri]ORC91024.1 putative spliceosome-associated protein [Trypanosoma theileri]
MSIAKKKKLARRQRHEELKERGRLIQARLRATADEEIEYVLPDDDSDVDGISSSTTTAGVVGSGNGDGAQSNNNENANEEEDEDRVHLPSVNVNDTQKKSGASTRRRTKVSWETLKLTVAERYGPEVAAVVSEHDGNAEDPYFTVLMKSVRNTVPVPRHWSQLRAFLSNQADRERATDIVPPEIAALGVERIRATRDKKANPDQIAFVTCFLSGTPLSRRRFHVVLSPFGDVFHEGKWLPRTLVEPGRLSARLRAALGMTAHAPPPWLYGMQAMRRLPPAYPALRVPGLNAPIPPGAQWGSGEGQWGQPPRNENNTFLFPGVMEEAAAEEVPHVYWGTVPPLVTSTTNTATTTTGTLSSAATTQQQQNVPPPPPPQNMATTGAKPVINPVPFHPQAYTPATAMRYVPTVPQEYVRVQDSTMGATVALGSVLVPKTAAGPTPPVAPSQVPDKRPVPPRPPTKF